MDLETKQYIDSLDKRSIPWRRMFTAYGTAENYCEYLSVLEHFSALLEDRYLLPTDYTEDDLFELFETPEAISDEQFYSLYYYAGIVLSQVPEILKRYGKQK